MAVNNNLLDVSQFFSAPDIVQKISDIIGQSVEKTKVGLNSVIPILTSGIIDKGSTKEGAKVLVDIVNSHHFETITKPDGNTLSEGSEVVNNIFGEELSSVSSNLGKTTGLGTLNITKIFSLAAPVIMGALGSKIKSEKLSTNGLMDFLGQQKNTSSVLAKVPSAPSEYDALVDSSREIPWKKIALVGVLLVIIWYVFWWITGLIVTRT